jgi:hypothetical protein
MSNPISLTLDAATGRWVAPCGCAVEAVAWHWADPGSPRVTLYPCGAHGNHVYGVVEVSEELIARIKDARHGGQS